MAFVARRKKLTVEHSGKRLPVKYPKNRLVVRKPKTVQKKVGVTYSEFVKRMKETGSIVLKRAGPAATVSTVTTMIRQQGWDPRNVTIFVDAAAWSAAAGLAARDIRVKQRLREEEEKIRRLREGVYEPFESLSSGKTPLRGVPAWEYMPLLQISAGKAKTRKQQQLRKEMNLLGDYLTAQAQKGANILFPEIKRGRKVLRVKDSHKALMLSGSAHKKHTVTTVQLASFIFNRYRHFLERKDVPNSVKETIRLSGEIANEGKQLGYFRHRLEKIPSDFPFMMFSRRMQEVITKKKAPKLELLKMLRFYAETVGEKSR